MVEDEYIAFIDESGDAVLSPIDPQFPILVLAICIFRRSDYRTSVIPRLRELKLAYFGRSDIVLHEREIRQRRGVFTSIGSEATRIAFMNDLTQTLDELPFTVIAVAADKLGVVAQRGASVDLYQECVRRGLSNAYEYLSNRIEQPLPLQVIVESRGRSEDRKLKSEFDAFQYPPSEPMADSGFVLSFETKRTGEVGLEVADLIAYPVARHVLGRPQTHNPFGLVQSKMFRGPQQQLAGYGLTIIDR